MQIIIYRDCIIGRYIAKEFIVDTTEELKLFLGVVKTFNQRTKLFGVYFSADDTTEHYTYKEVKPCLQLFEKWYSTVSNKGQRFTRKQACPIIVKSYRQQKFLEVVKASHPSDATTPTASSSVATTTAADPAVAKEKLGAKIAVMKVKYLRSELEMLNLNSKGKKEELQQRLCDYHKVKMPEKAVPKTKQKKHGAKWVNKKLTVTKAPFTDADFNDTSLRKHLSGYSESKMPEPHECHDFFFTEEMWDDSVKSFNAYPKYMAAQQTRPPWTPANQPWPPLWTANPLVFSKEDYQHHTMLLHLMGVKRLGSNSVRKMFSTAELHVEAWLKKLTSRDKFE